jgi:hypothetical protein
MPKTPQPNGYQISVDRVIEPGQVTADRKIAVLVTAGGAHLRLELEPMNALRLADGIMAALREMTGPPEPATRCGSIWQRWTPSWRTSRRRWRG